MKILFDTLGGDNAPYEIIKGALAAKEEYDIIPCFIGNKKEVSEILKDITNEDFEIVDAPSKIENDEEPAFAIRKKKDSSIVVGMTLLKDKKYDAFLSAGSTGALLAGGLFIVGRANGVKRAVLPTALPTLKGTKTYIIDSGANMDVDSNLLVQFAELGSTYLKNEGISEPRVGLLNVGTEKGKGNALTKESYELLENANINFIGNVEAREIPFGVCDLVVCDGFVGNVLLKVVEGVAYMLMKTLEITSQKMGFDEKSLKNIATLLKTVGSNLDSSEVGGVLLLGLKEIVIKAHGSSDAKAIKNATKAAKEAYDKKIIYQFENLGGNDER